MKISVNCLSIRRNNLERLDWHNSHNVVHEQKHSRLHNIKTHELKRELALFVRVAEDNQWDNDDVVQYIMYIIQNEYGK